MQYKNLGRTGLLVSRLGLGGAPRGAGEGRRAGAQMQHQIEQNRSRLQAYESLCSEIGQEPSHVALAWLLQHPVVTATIVGPRTPEQLSASLPALDVVLSPDTLRRLDQIWPGPGGEAPEAYAW